MGCRAAKLGFEGSGGIVYPGENQLEGTASGWNTYQSLPLPAMKENQVVFGSSDVPLVQFGAINTGRFLPAPARNHPPLLGAEQLLDLAQASQELKSGTTLLPLTTIPILSPPASGWGSRIHFTRQVPEEEKRGGSRQSGWRYRLNLLLVVTPPGTGRQ